MAGHNLKQASATILFTFISILFFNHNSIKISVFGDSSPPIYNPTDNIVLDCGTASNSTVYGDTCTWIGDINSAFFPSQLLHNSASVALQSETPSSGAPYATMLLSRSEFTYIFPLTPGQKFIRFYFYLSSFPNFDRSNVVFSVRAGGYALLCDFNASVNVDASGSDTVFREFYLFVEGNGRKLIISFTPTNRDMFAFINGVEIVSMPINLYYTPP